MEENRESNQINVGSVIRSSVFPGCDVLQWIANIPS